MELADEQAAVTPIELFFDLVFVFALTQALLLFLWVRFGGAAQGAGPFLPGQGRLRRR
jgi:low temperature requirement protein LtrA